MRNSMTTFTPSHAAPISLHAPVTDQPNTLRSLARPQRPAVAACSATSLSAARVPERVARGVYSSGKVGLDSPKDSVWIFLQGTDPSPSCLARIVLTRNHGRTATCSWNKDLGNYEPRPYCPRRPAEPPQNQRPTIQEIYETLKNPSMNSGAGSLLHSVLLAIPQRVLLRVHQRFYPTSAVSARVSSHLPSAPRFPATLTPPSSNTRPRRQKGRPAQGDHSGTCNARFLSPQNLRRESASSSMRSVISSLE